MKHRKLWTRCIAALLSIISAFACFALSACGDKDKKPADNTPEEYTVTFDLQGHGAAIGAKKVNSGEKVAEPTEPTDSEYDFGGWYKEAGCENKYDFNSAVTGNFTLYAKWTPKSPATPTQYTVTFDLQGHGAAIDAKSVNEGGKVAEPAEPTDSEYDFGGWYKEAGCENKYDFNSAVTGNFTLYAKWTPKQTTPADTSVPFTGKVYFVGDSTVCEFDDKYYIPRYGYGTQLYNYLNCDKNNIVNIALSGRSSWSYTYNLSQDSSNKCKLDATVSCYEYLCSHLSAGDYLIIGFGHNDEKTEVKRYTDPTLAANDQSTMIGDYNAQRPVSFKYILKHYYIDVAKEKGATPILCTPIVRLQTDANKAKYDTDHTTTTGSAKATDVEPNVTTTWNGGNYPSAIKALAEEEDLLCIDLTQTTREEYKAMTYEEASLFHAATGAEWVDKTAKTDKKPTGTDNTHTNYYGAMKNAYYIAQAIKNSDLPLKNSVRTDKTKPVYEDYEQLCINADYVIPDTEPFNPQTDVSTHWTGITGVTADATEPHTQYKWYATAFGNGVKVADYTIAQSGDADNPSFRISAADGKGKIASDNDMLAAVFIQVPFDTAFTVTAKANVEKYGGNQAGFGIMIRDDIHIDFAETVSSNYVNAGLRGDSKTNYYGYCRNGGALSNSQQKGEAPVGEYNLTLSRTSQSISVQINNATIGNKTYAAESDFDLAVADSRYVYICLWATRGTTVTYSDITFTSGVWQQA